MERLIPIRPLGHGSFGIVYLAYHTEMGIVSVKLIMKNKRNDLREYECNAQEQEWKSVIQITNQQNSCPFILKYKRYNYNHQGEGIAMDYANMGTLNIIAKQPHIPLPSHTLRALMKQILEGVRVIHATNLIHRDIKCDNILLHSPPGSERVYVKIADFGLAKKEDSMYELTNAGTLPYQPPEQFHENPIITQKVDIYAVGITFYKLITHKYPVEVQNKVEYQQKIVQLESIGRPQEIKDDILWDLLSKLLEFDPDKRITAEQAIQHPYFTSPQAIADISKEQQDLAKLTIKAQLQEGDSSITEFDKDPTFIVAESLMKLMDKYIKIL
ncbi:MAG: putative aurora kinase [Streblomastix strix]|uniref:Putative aurora kinase n=1 Tax=Streblomastix strix TaxID=222440 RepID=A0A5J4VZW8_9EUKA|nr:MAG: putative aurora kinase [Streblomastix strix]